MAYGDREAFIRAQRLEGFYRLWPQVVWRLLSCFGLYAIFAALVVLAVVGAKTLLGQ